MRLSDRIGRRIKLQGLEHPHGSCAGRQHGEGGANLEYVAAQRIEIDCRS